MKFERWWVVFISGFLFPVSGFSANYWTNSTMPGGGYTPGTNVISQVYITSNMVVQWNAAWTNSSTATFTNNVNYLIGASNTAFSALVKGWLSATSAADHAYADGLTNGFVTAGITSGLASTAYVGGLYLGLTNGSGSILGNTISNLAFSGIDQATWPAQTNYHLQSSGGVVIFTQTNLAAIAASASAASSAAVAASNAVLASSSNVWTVARNIPTNKLHVAIYGQSYVDGSSVDGYGGDSTLTNPLAHAWMVRLSNSTNMTPANVTNVVALATNSWSVEITGAKTMFAVQGVTNYFTRWGWDGQLIQNLIPGLDYWKSFTNLCAYTTSNYPVAGKPDCLWYLQNVANNDYTSVYGVNNYASNLTLIVSGFRAVAAAPDAPVFLMGANAYTGSATTFDFSKMRELERRYAASNTNVYFVRCDDIALPDPTNTSHMDAAGYKELGRRFGDATLAHFGGVTNKTPLVVDKVWFNDARARRLDASYAVIDTNNVRVSRPWMERALYDVAYSNNGALGFSTYRSFRPAQRTSAAGEYIWSFTLLQTLGGGGGLLTNYVSASSANVARVSVGQMACLFGGNWDSAISTTGMVHSIDAANSNIVIKSTVTTACTPGASPVLYRVVPLVKVTHNAISTNVDSVASVFIRGAIGETTASSLGMFDNQYHIQRTAAGAWLGYKTNSTPTTTGWRAFIYTTNNVSYQCIYRNWPGSSTTFNYMDILFWGDGGGANCDIQPSTDF